MRTQTGMLQDVLAGTPRGPVAVPSAVCQQARGEAIRPVWVNEVGGITFVVGTGPESRFVKWAPAGCIIDLREEVARLRWAADFVRVPGVLAQGANKEGSWIVTRGLPGENAVSDRWKADPATAVSVIGRGLRAMHDVLPVAACPFTWSVEDRIADARRRAADDLLEPAGWHAVHQHLSVAGALELLADSPDIDEFVVCHGDACAPNTVVTDDGALSGYVDLGALGVADRWADLAIATWSTEWNYGPGWEELLLDSYGIHPDHQRTSFYRLLWDLG